MSKTWERYHQAARHHERAAHHYKTAAKYDQAEEHEKAAHHAYLAPDTLNRRFITRPWLPDCMSSAATLKRPLPSRKATKRMPLEERLIFVPRHK